MRDSMGNAKLVAPTSLYLYGVLTRPATGCEPPQLSVDRDMTAEFAALLALVLLNAQMCAEAIKHLNYLGCLAFGQQIDLQIEMVQSIGDTAHTVLLVRQESWRDPAGGRPARVSRSGRPIASVGFKRT